METEKITIPENIQQMCRDFAEVARKHRLRKFSGSFSPNFDMDWGGDVSFAWEWGRHGDDSNILKITSQFYVHTTVSGKQTN